MTKPFSPLVGVTDISTHILTKRMTIDIASVIPPKIISTHILTKRMTRIRCPDSTDIAFQLTSSRRGWRRHWIHFFWIGDISTHILTKRMTLSLSPSHQYSLFQLTSSRRGWQFQQSVAFRNRYFNSHPHEEDDVTKHTGNSVQCISTHILTKRMTI